MCRKTTNKQTICRLHQDDTAEILLFGYSDLAKACCAILNDEDGELLRKTWLVDSA
ncbi:hypothetical protein J6590_043934, partial [Homalodisca vitripennis]